MARIAIDARISRSWSTGVGVYTVRLLEALHEIAPHDGYVLFTAAGAPPAPLAPDLPVVQWQLPYEVGGLGQHLRLPRTLRAFGVDVLIVTHPACAPLWSSLPTLVIVHDLIPLALPQYYSRAKRLYYQTVLRWSLRRAARVLVDSESTRRDCERLLGLPPDRLRVIYGGVDGQFSSGEERAEHPAGRPYVLYVGNKRPHKNIDRLIEAFALLRDDVSFDHDLVIAGRDEAGDVETDSRRLRALCDRLGLNGRVRFVGEVPAGELPTLYRDADAFAYLSSYEGFGLPPLEAMACGTPVVALNASAMPEVVGTGGILLDSPEPAVVANALRTVVEDRALRGRLSRRAVRRARRFSWERTARAVAEEIDAAIGRERGALRGRRDAA